jgi:putative ABC transport system permease protein
MEFGPIFRTIARHRVRFFLIVAEVALTLALVVNCVSLILDARADLARESGFDDENLIQVVSQPFEEAFREPAYANRVVDSDVQALRSMPGVKAASNTVLSPWSGNVSITAVRPESQDQAEGTQTQVYVGDPALFDTLGIEVTQGRNFTLEEFERGNDGRSDVNVIVNQALADRLFPEGKALGQRLRYPGTEDPQVMTIVGIIDRYYKPAGENVSDRVMFSAQRTGSYEYGSQYLVRTEPGQAQAVLADLEATLLRVDPGRNFYLDTVPELRARAQSRSRTLVATLNGVMALLLLVTALGIVGITSFSVAERTRQIGVRRALGATRQDIVRYFLLENWMVTTFGALLGVALAVGLNIGLVNLAEGNRLSWPLLAAGVVLVWVIGQGAALGPALRGSRVPPAIATRNV